MYIIVIYGLYYIMFITGWSVMFGTVAESARIFFEVSSNNTHIKSLCYEDRTL